MDNKSIDNDEEDHRAKVVLLGAAGVGKTCLVLRFQTGNFPRMATPTIGASYMAKTVKINNESKIKLQMWDTAGQERFQSMASMYYRGADAAVLVFDCTDSSSLDSVKVWVKELQEHRDVSDDVVLTLAANKCDLQSANTKESKELMMNAKSYAESINAQLWKTSAKTSLNINALFDDIARRVFQIKMENDSFCDSPRAITFEHNIQQNQNKCCGSRR